MKFDADRAMRTLEALSAAPGPVDDAGRGAAEIVIASLEHSGWTVQSDVLTGSSSASAVLSALAYLFWLVWATGMLALIHFQADWRWFALAVGLVPVRFVLSRWVLPFALERVPPLGEARLVVASRGDDDVHAPARLVVQAALGPMTGPLGTTVRDFRRIQRVAAAASFLYVFWRIGLGTYPVAWPSDKTVVWGLCGLAWCLSPFWLIRCRRAVRSTAGEGSPDANAVAVLLELARIWPRKHSARVETVLVAAGGQRLGHVADRALRRIAERWPPKPTLIVALAAPGLGRELLIRDSTPDQLVMESARKLWIPHHHAKASEIPKVIRPLGGITHSELVWIEGAWFEDPPPSLDLDALARTIQLIEEAALVWARRHARPPDASAPDLNASRSAQNPG